MLLEILEPRELLVQLVLQEPLELPVQPEIPGLRAQLVLLVLPEPLV